MLRRAGNDNLREARERLANYVSPRVCDADLIHRNRVSIVRENGHAIYMYLGRSVASAAPELGNLPQQTFGHFSSQFFTGDSLGERVTIQADHQHALTARIKAIADDVRTVIPKEGAGFSPSARVQGQHEMQDRLRQLCPGFIVLSRHAAAMPHEINGARHQREEV